MRVVFMGTPEFAVPSLTALARAGFDIVGAITQPDRPSGRGRKTEACPVKRAALALGVPVYQFEKLRRQEGLDCLRALKPDLCVTAAFGQILSKKLLEVPKMGTINVHASLLPRHRGAAPINWSIIMGDEHTGVTTMLTDAGLDTGDMLLARSTPIGATETAGELTARLAQMGAELLIETIAKYSAGALTPRKQDESLMSYEPMLSKQTGLIRWEDNARDIVNIVRGTDPWPGAHTTYNAQMLKIWAARALNVAGGAPPGTLTAASPKDGLIVECGFGTSLEITEIQAPNARRMPASAYMAGNKLEIGKRLGE